jgi:hypothetical protein
MTSINILSIALTSFFAPTHRHVFSLSHILFVVTTTVVTLFVLNEQLPRTLFVILCKCTGWRKSDLTRGVSRAAEPPPPPIK